MSCIWCEQGRELEKIAVKVATLPCGSMYLHRDQTHKGRCLFVYKDHVQKLTELDQSQYLALMGDVYKTITAITKTFLPDKVNMLVLGDMAMHIHIHLCPKYRDGKEWGQAFLVNEPHPLYLAESELEQIINALRENL